MEQRQTMEHIIDILPSVSSLSITSTLRMKNFSFSLYSSEGSTDVRPRGFNLHRIIRPSNRKQYRSGLARRPVIFVSVPSENSEWMRWMKWMRCLSRIWLAVHLCACGTLLTALPAAGFNNIQLFSHRVIIVAQGSLHKCSGSHP